MLPVGLPQVGARGEETQKNIDGLCYEHREHLHQQRNYCAAGWTTDYTSVDCARYCARSKIGDGYRREFGHAVRYLLQKLLNDRKLTDAAEAALHCRYKRIRPKENRYPLHYSGIETEKAYRFKIS